jgi:hypothetical protein
MPKTMSTATEADVTGMPKAASGVNCRCKGKSDELADIWYGQS